MCVDKHVCNYTTYISVYIYNIRILPLQTMQLQLVIASHARSAGGWSRQRTPADEEDHVYEETQANMAGNTEKERHRKHTRTQLHASSILKGGSFCVLLTRQIKLAHACDDTRLLSLRKRCMFQFHRRSGHLQAGWGKGAVP